MHVINWRMLTGHASIRALMEAAFADSTYSLSWEPVLAEVPELVISATLSGGTSHVGSVQMGNP
jgi:hypothetical protein